MDKTERQALARHMQTLARWLKNGGKVEKPNAAIMEAIEAAIITMQGMPWFREDYEQPVAILQYHAEHPAAVLLRDPVTIRTMKTAIDAMGHRLGRRR